jgi:hypothetical protein
MNIMCLNFSEKNDHLQNGLPPGVARGVVGAPPTSHPKGAFRRFLAGKKKSEPVLHPAITHRHLSHDKN